MASRKRGHLVAVVFTALLLTTAACGGSRPNSGSADAPSSITISVAGQYLSIYGPLWASTDGFDSVAKQFHTTIRYSTYGSGGTALTALLGGSVQIAAGASATQGLEAAAAGKSLSYVANIFRGGGVVMIGAKKYEASRQTNIANYANATFGYTAEGSTSQVFSQAIVEHAGLKWSTVQHLALGSITAFEPALATGRADIVAMDPDSAAKAVADGVGYPVVNTNVAALFTPVAGTILDNGLIVTPSFKQQYPKLLQALVTAFVDGLLKLRDVTSPTQALTLMPSAFKNIHNDAKLFALSWAFSQPAFAQTDGSAPANAIAATEKLVLMPNQRTTPEVDQFFDNSLVNAAYTQLKANRPTGS
jgi:ABC-type nitrate/sulfonate/bicarbonate transport system substrate-binding protein